MTIRLKVELLNDRARTPVKAHDTDAGFDIASTDYYAIAPGDFVKVSTGLKLQIPTGWYGQLCSRSGLALKKGLIVLQGVGVIDSGYEGEVMVLLYNSSTQTQVVDVSDRIAQLLLLPVPSVIVEVQDAIASSSDRGEGGFGSTGVFGDPESLNLLEVPNY